MSIIVKKLTHIYGFGTQSAVTALDNITLEINSGEFVGLIGHTGSGKSTFAQHINALILPTSGELIVDGIDVSQKKNRMELRRKVGMVFQYPEYQLFEETVLKDICFGPLNHGESPEKAKELAKVAMNLVELDFDEFSEKSPFELSGGEKRRVALAGIIATKPTILVLDEPMAGLDPVGRQEILSLIKALHGAGMTIVMISHSMEDIASCATKVLVFNNAKVAFYGSVEDVFSRADELIAMGLDVPEAARIASELRHRGIDVPYDAFDNKTLLMHLARRFENGR